MTFFKKLISIGLQILVCILHTEHAYVQDNVAPNAENIPIKIKIYICSLTSGLRDNNKYYVKNNYTSR